MSALLALLVLLVIPGACWSAPSFAINQPAAIAIGQSSLLGSGINGSAGVAASGLFSPGGVWSDGNILIVADTGNNRVLIYYSVPVVNGTQADVVIGQPDTTSNAPNQGGARAGNTLSLPTAVFFDGTSLYVVDQGNNRILIFNALPSSNNTAADVVVGQPNMGTGGAGLGPAVLNRPAGVYSDGNSLYVADQNNHRVLIFAPIPTSNGASANVAVGQANLNSGNANQGANVSSVTLNLPAGVWVDSASSRMFIADQGNNRVLIYNSVPAVSNSSANVVVGQVGMTSSTINAGGLSARSLFQPAQAVTDGANLYVADQSNNRILIYSPIPTANRPSASVVVGQPGMSSNGSNQGGAAPSAATLSRPVGLISVGNALYAADQNNNRILLYGSIPAANDPSASIVVGQNDMITGVANQAASVSGANTAYRPAGVYTDRTRLYVADRFNNRVLIFNAPPSASNASADLVVGQPDMLSNASNQGGTPSTGTLSFPNDVAFDGTRLIVADQSNNRILLYNGLPAANGPLASVAVGQPNMTSNRVNQGGSVSSNTLNSPAGVASDGARLFISDRLNNRVLLFTPVPAVSNATASVVLGQVSMTTAAANQGLLLPTARTLNSPAGVYFDGTRLFVADQGNNRVLIYNGAPAVNNSSASVVVGQADMIHNQPNQGGGIRANTLRGPSAVFSDGTSLYVTDSGNNRLLIFKNIPTANNAAADYVLGQATFTAGNANSGGQSTANTLFSPGAVAVDSTTGRLYLTDSNNNRTMLYLPAAGASLGSLGGTVALNSAIEPLAAQLSVPPGALSQSANFILGAQSGFPSAPSSAGTAKATGIGLQVTLDQPFQPSGNVSLTVSYAPADLAAFDKSKLILARFDPSDGLWVPLSSVSDPLNSRVVAQTDHFSLFQIMAVDSSHNTISSARVFPNPLQPSSGQTAMTFSQMLPGARVRIYTVSGTLIKDFSADSTGIARWDGTNQAGAGVASGVYFAFIQGSGENHTLKVAVQR